MTGEPFARKREKSDCPETTKQHGKNCGTNEHRGKGKMPRATFVFRVQDSRETGRSVPGPGKEVSARSNPDTGLFLKV